MPKPRSEIKAEYLHQKKFLLSAIEPGFEHWCAAGLVALALCAAFLATLPFAHLPLSGTENLLPACAAVLLLTDIVTAALLFSMYSAQPSRALLVLSSGYLFAGMMVIPWIATFPGAFAPEGMLGAGLQSTATIAAVRRIGFPLFVIAYVMLKPVQSRARPVADVRTNGHILFCIFGTALIASAITWLVLAGEGILPGWMIDQRRTAPVWTYVLTCAAILCFTAVGLLLARGPSILDLWLMVAIVSSLIEMLLLGVVSSGRLSLGWWAGRFYGVIAASVVLIALLAELSSLYTRLVRSLTAERRGREERLMTLEAVSASIAHEVNQPLATIVTNANAGLSWLDRKTPKVGEAIAALNRVVRDGHRAGHVIQGIRAMYKKDASSHVLTEINGLTRDAVDHIRVDARLAGVSLSLSLSEALPWIEGDPIQLQQVVLNLCTNAIDSMADIKGERDLQIATTRSGSGEVIVSVADTGSGLAAESRDKIFESFFTTKTHGMGMGLVICRFIIEAHGGRIWVTQNRPTGAVFHFSLPAAEGSRGEAERYE